MPRHIHMLVAIPPKYSVAQVVGYIKGKSAIAIARNHTGRKRNFTGESFWARGYYVSTVGRNEEAIRRYARWPRTASLNSGKCSQIDNIQGRL